MEAKKQRASVDWEAVERDYRAGQVPVRQIADMYGCSTSGLMAKAKKRGWTREPKFSVYTAERSEELRKNAKPGFVYVVTFDSGNGEELFKIGMSEDPVKRIAQQQCGNPFELRIVMSYYVGNMAAEEANLHLLYEHVHVRGEWFRLNDSDLQHIASRALRG